MTERFARFRDALSTTTCWALALGGTAAALAGTALLPRIAQPKGYHHFADERALLGIPYSLNVLSNLPFLLVGLAGVWWIFGRADARHFRDPRERWPAAVLFAGLITTAAGSAYYHLDPNNQTLVFDRLGMVVSFGALLPLAIGERVSPRWGARLVAPFVALGVALVLYWNYTELKGAGDLRWYGLYQAFAFFATAAVLLLTRPTYDRQRGWVLAIGCYAFAKIFELFDQPLYGLTGHAISGHSLKHVIAAAGGVFVLQMLMERRALTPAPADGAVFPVPQAVLAD